MPRKQKPKLDAAKEVKRIARERVGTVPPTRVADTGKEHRKEKHRKTLQQLAEE